MDLSNEAIIYLRAPSKLGLPAPPSYQKPAITFLTGKPSWFPIFSTLPLSRYQRKPPRHANFRLQILPGSQTYTATESWIDPNDKPDPLEVEVRPRISTIVGQVLDVGDNDVGEKTASYFREDGAERGWEVIAWGKQGQLESWMIEDPSGLICDSSGEGRPDWRNSYAVVYHEATGVEEAGIEVWDSYAKYRRLTDGTLQKIKDALRKTGVQELAKLADALRVVPVE